MYRDTPTIYLTLIRSDKKTKDRIDLSDRIKSLEYVDSEKSTDTLQLRVDNWDLANFDDPVWRKGNIVEVMWGYPGRMSPPRKMVIQKVTGFQELTIEARDKGVLLNLATKARAFEGKTYSQIVEEIAEENGFGPDNRYIEVTEEIIPIVNQARLTDGQFLKRLAYKNGFQFYIDFDGLHWHDRVIRQELYREFSWLDANLNTQAIQAISIENDITGKPGKFTKKGRDPASKQDIEESGSNEGTDKESLADIIEFFDPETREFHERDRRDKVPDAVVSSDTAPTAESTSSKAKKLADGKYKKTQQTAVKATFTVLGDPLMVAKTVIKVSGLGKRLSGRYYVKKVKHSIGEGYLMEISGVSDGTAGLEGLFEPEQANKPPKTDEDFEEVDLETRKTYDATRDIETGKVTRKQLVSDFSPEAED